MTDAPRTSALDALIARLLQTGDQAVPGGPPPPEELAQARAASAVPMPAELERVYLRADGVYLPHGAALFDTYDFAAVNERAHLFTDLPGAVALWVGDGPGGVRYAVTLGVWRDLPEDRLVAVAEGGDPATAPVLGRLADVVASWVEAP